MLELVSNNCKRLGSPVGHLLTVPVLQENAPSLKLGAVDLKSMARDLKSTFSAEAAERIRIEVPGVIPPVEFDRIYLFIMLRNLLDNALKYSPEERPVILSAKKEENKVLIKRQGLRKGHTTRQGGCHLSTLLSPGRLRPPCSRL